MRFLTLVFLLLIACSGASNNQKTPTESEQLFRAMELSRLEWERENDCNPRKELISFSSHHSLKAPLSSFKLAAELNENPYCYKGGHFVRIAVREMPASDLRVALNLIEPRDIWVLHGAAISLVELNMNATRKSDKQAIEKLQILLEIGLDPNFVYPKTIYSSSTLLTGLYMGDEYYYELNEDFMTRRLSFNVEAARIILEHGGDPLQADTNGEIPLLKATRTCNYPLIRLFASRSDRPVPLTKDGLTPRQEFMASCDADEKFPESKQKKEEVLQILRALRVGQQS